MAAAPAVGGRQQRGRRRAAGRLLLLLCGAAGLVGVAVVVAWQGTGTPGVWHGGRRGAAGTQMDGSGGTACWPPRSGHDWQPPPTLAQCAAIDPACRPTPTGCCGWHVPTAGVGGSSSNHSSLGGVALRCAAYASPSATRQQCCCEALRYRQPHTPRAPPTSTFTCLPLVLLPGAIKGGSTAVWRALAAVPGFVGHVKEIGVLPLAAASAGAGVATPLAPQRTPLLWRYLAALPPAPTNVSASAAARQAWAAAHFTVDGSVALASLPHGAATAAAVLPPTTAIVVALRDGVDRAWSEAAMVARRQATRPGSAFFSVVEAELDALSRVVKPNPTAHPLQTAAHSAPDCVHAAAARLPLHDAATAAGVQGVGALQLGGAGVLVRSLQAAALTPLLAAFPAATTIIVPHNATLAHPPALARALWHALHLPAPHACRVPAAPHSRRDDADACAVALAHVPFPADIPLQTWASPSAAQHAFPPALASRLRAFFGALACPLPTLPVPA